jgi:hypothetical protein
MKYVLVLLLVAACDRPSETQYGSCTELAAEAQRRCDHTWGTVCDTRLRDAFEACERETSLGHETCLHAQYIGEVRICVKARSPRSQAATNSEVP